MGMCADVPWTGRLIQRAAWRGQEWVPTWDEEGSWPDAVLVLLKIPRRSGRKLRSRRHRILGRARQGKVPNSADVSAWKGWWIPRGEVLGEQ